MKQIKVELQETMGTDKTIADSAWTSSLTFQDKQNRSKEDVERVVNMLADNKHSSPFESIIFRFWFKLPIAIDRQLMTHRIASHNGLSGRYRKMPTEFFELPQDVTSILKINSKLKYQKQYNKLCKQTNSFYSEIVDDIKNLKDNKIITNDEYKRVRESFRGVLPQHNMTERVTTMNLRSFANFIKLRLSSSAQPEIRYLAQLMLNEIKTANICPIAIEALERNNWVI